MVIRCAFLEVHMEVEMFAAFGDVDGIVDIGDESVQQKGPLVEAQGRGRGLGC